MVLSNVRGLARPANIGYRVEILTRAGDEVHIGREQEGSGMYARTNSRFRTGVNGESGTRETRTDSSGRGTWFT